MAFKRPGVRLPLSPPSEKYDETVLTVSFLFLGKSKFKRSIGQNWAKSLSVESFL